MNTTGGRKVSKADLLELARALGDEEVDEGESMLCIFQRCLERAHELNAPTHLFATRFPHPKVRAWCAQLMDYAEERRRDDMAKLHDQDEKWTWYTVYGMVRDSTGRPCVHNFAPGAHTCMRGNCHVHIDEVPVDESCRHKFVDSKACLLCGVTANVLKAKHRRELEQLEATGPRPAARAIVECQHAGELAIDRATGEESCSDCPVVDDFAITPALPSMPFQLETADVVLTGISFGDEVPSAGAIAPIENPGDSPVTLACGDRRVTIEPGTIHMLQIRKGDSWVVVDRRDNAEQWAKTQGSKGGATHA